MCLLEGTQSRTVCDVATSEMERSAEINTAFGVELRSVVRKCKKVPLKKGFEAGPGCLHLRLRVGKLSLASHHVGETPANSGSPVPAAGISNASASLNRPQRE
jgi:hypothetical protein